MREPSRSERRIVTCVFIDIVGSTDLTVKFGSERMRLMLDEAFAEIRAILQAQGATIEKYAGHAARLPASGRSMKAMFWCVLTRIVSLSGNRAPNRRPPTETPSAR